MTEYTTEAALRQNYASVSMRLRGAPPAATRVPMARIQRRPLELAYIAPPEPEPLALDFNPTTIGTLNVTSIAEMGIPKRDWREIVAEVAERHNIGLRELTGLSCRRAVVLARHEAMWRLSKETGCSTTQIGEKFCRDHTTTMYACRRYQDYLDRLARSDATEGVGYYDKDGYRKPTHRRNGK